MNVDESGHNIFARNIDGLVALHIVLVKTDPAVAHYNITLHDALSVTMFPLISRIVFISFHLLRQLELRFVAISTIVSRCSLTAAAASATVFAFNHTAMIGQSRRFITGMMTGKDHRIFMIFIDCRERHFQRPIAPRPDNGGSENPYRT